MGPKRKPIASTNQPAPGAGTGRRQTQPGPRGRGQFGRRRPGRPAGPPTGSRGARWTEWFTLATHQITNSTPAGILDAYTLHPQTLPLTPYAAAVANHAHRREFRWDFRIYMTTATTTGTRMAVLVLPDPTHTTKLSADMVWSAVCNNRGVMVDSSGNMSRQASFSIRSATTTLSNAQPPGAENYLGYSSGTLNLWLLQPPLGITDSAVELQCTVMARCLLLAVNPLPGFALSQMGLGENATVPHGPPAWQITRVTSKLPDSKSMYESTEPWAKSHTGNIILAGGWYFDFWNHASKVPIAGSSSVPGTGESKGITIKGVPKTMTVYTCSSSFPQWQTNRRNYVTPKYFAVITGVVTSTCLMVGFNTMEDACNQVLKKWMAIPPEAELCIRYDKAPTWGDFHPQNAQGEMHLTFYEVYTTSAAQPIYTNSNGDPASPFSLDELYLPIEGLQLEAEPAAETDEDEPPPLEEPEPQGATGYTAPSAPPVDFFHLSQAEIDEAIHHHNEQLWKLHRAKAALLYPAPELQKVKAAYTPQPEPPEEPPRRSSSLWDMLKAAITSRRKDLE
nr:hypothetical protein 3 [Mute swan feces associated tombus-like virus 5]